MKQFSLGLFFLILCFETISQGKYRDGYIINIQRDTIRGTLLYQSDSKNYLACSFNETGGTKKEYLPSDIYSFAYENGKSFTSGIVENSFVEMLVEGELSLYKLGDQFIVKKGQETKRLVNNKIAPNELGFVKDKASDLQWKGILSFITKECTSQLQPRINKSGFTEKALSRIAVAYNQCIGGSYIEPKSGRSWTQIDAGLIAGVTRTTIRVLERQEQASYLLDRYETYDPAFGFAFIFTSPRISEDLSFQIELLSINSTFSATHAVSSVSRFREFDTRFKVNKLSIPISLKYTISTRSIKPYFLLGISADILIQSDLIVNETLTFDEETSQIVDREPFIVNRGQMGLWTGLGIQKSLGDYKVGAFVSTFFFQKFMDQPPTLRANNHRNALSIYILKSL